MNKDQAQAQEAKNEFSRALARLDAEIARFQTAVDEFCEAKKEFIATL
jgi:phage host-nuclease inhibitor protein Gam